MGLVVRGVLVRGDRGGGHGPVRLTPSSPVCVSEVPASDGDWDSGVSLQDAEGCR